MAGNSSAETGGNSINMKLLLLGDSAVSAHFGEEICPEINQQVTALRDALEEAVAKGEIQGLGELVPTYCALLINYDPLVLGYDELVAKLKELSQSLVIKSDSDRQVVEIPVAYGGEYGPDLAEVAAAHGMTEQQVIDIHSQPEYPIYMLGFVAGFPYLGGMSPEIATPRKESPRLKIEAGSVGIAGSQTGIYSVESPGGWQIIGRTPLKLYDTEREDPVLLSAGQYIKFKPISGAEYEAMVK